MKRRITQWWKWLLIAGAIAAAPTQAFAVCIFEGLVGGYSQYRCFGDSTGTTVVGTAGNERFIFDAGATGTPVTIISGGGSDIIDFSGYGAGISLNLAAGPAQPVAPGLSLTLADFNNAGQSYTVLGPANGSTLTGGDGNDTLTGGAGIDSLSGCPAWQLGACLAACISTLIAMATVASEHQQAHAFGDDGETMGREIQISVTLRTG